LQRSEMTRSANKRHRGCDPIISSARTRSVGVTEEFPNLG
jgi:hypothetical protein